MASSLKGKADLWRTGKDGVGPHPRRTKTPGGGPDFAATANYRKQYEGDHKTGGGGMNAPSSLDNQDVFANSTAGLAVKDKPFLPNPGKGRTEGLDMYAVKSNLKETNFGLDMAKQPPTSSKQEGDRETYKD